MKKVSVIIPCYNQGEYIDDCIQSVFKQTYKNIEIVLVNDGSTDKLTNMKINEIKNKFQIIIVLEIKNSGLSSARNYGINNSTGDYILPLDADDIIHPEYIEKAAKVLNGNTNVGIVYSDYKFFGCKNDIVYTPEFSIEKLLFSNYITACSMFRKKDWIKVNGYSKNMIYGLEDWDFWLKLIQTGVSAFKLKGVYFFYRKKECSMINNLNQSELNKSTMNIQIFINNIELYKNYVKDIVFNREFKNLIYYYEIDYYKGDKIINNIKGLIDKKEKKLKININNRYYGEKIKIKLINSTGFFKINNFDLYEDLKIHNQYYKDGDCFLCLEHNFVFEFKLSKNNNFIEVEFITIGSILNKRIDLIRNNIEKILNVDVLYGYSEFGNLIYFYLTNFLNKSVKIYDKNKKNIPKKLYIDIFSENLKLKNLNILITSLTYEKEIKEKLKKHGFSNVVSLNE